MLFPIEVDLYVTLKQHLRCKNIIRLTSGVRRGMGWSGKRIKNNNCLLLPLPTVWFHKPSVKETKET